MKTILITLAIVSFMSIANINNSFAQKKNYVNVSVENNVRTAVSCVGYNDTNLQLARKAISKYDQDGARVEKTYYKWDNENWVPILNYQFTYSSNKKLASVQCSTWDANSKIWQSQGVQTYTNSDGRLFTSLIEK